MQFQGIWYEIEKIPSAENTIYEFDCTQDHYNIAVSEENVQIYINRTSKWR